jgi:predicted lipoprotein with Yx(FWY)xxD motif
MTTTRFRWLMVVLAAAALLAAACGDDGDAGGGGGGTSVTTIAPATDPTTAPTTGDATVTVVTSELGDILADGEGRTLYIFTVDEPDTSNCTDGCLDAWPRFAPGAAIAGDGVDESLLGTISVDDVEQLTVAERPLYYFSGDSAAGDVNGQGVGGNWFVVGADGTPIESV